MSLAELSAKADSYVATLCSVKPNRRTGSPGNREATEFFANTMHSLGYEVDASPFDALDYIDEGSVLTVGMDNYEVFTSPYSEACDVRAELVVASSIETLEIAECKEKVLLMIGDLCAEQLMPKNFVFYNPEHHQKMISLLERKAPAAIIAATTRSPEQVGALYPFPLIVDGDFDIPSVYCREAIGAKLAGYQGYQVGVEIRTRRIPSSATNIIATLNPGMPRKIVLTAHIDAYEDSPGASDNASGTAVLLLAGEILSDYRGENSIEIAALNGEDHFSAGGQMDYLNRYRREFPSITLAVNIDDVGYRKGRSAYSFYDCSEELGGKAEDAFKDFDGLCRGEPWFSGDHMIFVQNKVPAIAITAEQMPELMKTVTHTSEDTPDLLDYRKLVVVAELLNKLVRTL